MELDGISKAEREYREQQHRPWISDEVGHMEAFRSALRGSTERRDMFESVQSSGGYFVPQQFHDELIAMVKAMDRLFDPEVVFFIESENGGPIQIPFEDDTSTVAVIVNEGQQSSFADVPTGNTTLAIAPTWRSKMVKASVELVQDTGYPLDKVLTEMFAKRIARGIGAANVTQLLGAATQGQLAIGSSSNTGGSETGGTSVGTDDLEALIDSVDEAYRLSPKCRWLMKSATLKTILQVKNKQGNPVFYRERNAAGEVLLLGYPVAVSPSMPAIGLNNKPVMFGDLSRWVVRVAKNATRMRLYTERFADYAQVAYEMFLRSNATLAISTGSDSPVKYLQNAAA